MIYLNDHIWDFDLQEALPAVSPWRRQQALRYLQESDRRQSIAAWLLLKQALLLEYDIQQVPPFVYGPGGKPSLEGRPDIHFSLSHCSEAVSCVVDGRPVGIDVELITHADGDVVLRTMNDSERRLIAESAQPDVAFTRLWTMKESLFKLIGDTAKLPSGPDPVHLLEGDLTPYNFHTTITPRYILTVCQNQH